jgi:hypothetical protein
MEDDHGTPRTIGDFEEVRWPMRRDREEFRAYFKMRFDTFERSIVQLLSDTEARIIRIQRSIG